MSGKYKPEELIAFLEKEPSEFRSLAYESAAMGLAVEDLKQGNKFSKWQDFSDQFSAQHGSQIHVGLGWAFAKTEQSTLSFLSTLNPWFQSKVLDGIGYFEGMFRRRKAIRMQQVPDGFDQDQRAGYDQGIGRSAWYISKGNIEMTERIVCSFDEHRVSAIWRGVGVAAAYVGGMKDADWRKLMEASRSFRPQLNTGVALVAKARNDAGSLTGEISHYCELVRGEGLVEVIDKIKSSNHFEIL